MDKVRLLNLAREFKRIYESGKPYMPGQSWTLTQHQEDHDRRVERAQRLLSLEHIPRLTEGELRELFADTDALFFSATKGEEIENFTNFSAAKARNVFAQYCLACFKKLGLN